MPEAIVPIAPAKESDRSIRRRYGLRVRQWRFLKYYVGRAQGNARKAYLLAGYKSESDNTADAASSRLLSSVKIQRALEAELAKGWGSNGDIENALQAIAAGNSTAWMDIDPETGTGTINLQKMKEAGALGLIESYGFDANGLPKVKLYNRVQAMNVLCKIRGMILERREISGPNGGPIPVDHKVITDDDIIRARQVASKRTAKALPATDKGENGNGNGNGH